MILPVGKSGVIGDRVDRCFNGGRGVSGDGGVGEGLMGGGRTSGVDIEEYFEGLYGFDEFLGQ